MSRIAVDLFRTKGPEEPIKGRGPRQSSEEYIAGREDFLFGRPFRKAAYSDGWRQNSYRCGWLNEWVEAAQ